LELTSFFNLRSPVDLSSLFIALKFHLLHTLNSASARTIRAARAHHHTDRKNRTTICFLIINSFSLTIAYLRIMKTSSRVVVALRPAIRASIKPQLTPLLRPLSQSLRIPAQRRPFSYTYCPRKGLQPDSEDPKPPATEDHSGHHALEPAHIADSEYHELADQYIDTLVLTLEEMAEDVKNGLEVEYSVRHLYYPS